MRIVAAALAVGLLACAAVPAPVTVDWMEHAPLPMPISNNAVASVETDTGWELLSFAGLGAGKAWTDVTDRAYSMNVARGTWKTLPPVPGEQGRLASVAVGVDGFAYVFGGYTVAEDGSEVSTPEVYRFDPKTQSYELYTRMPVPVDDTVALPYLDRYVYLVSGWHDKANVELVQVLDVTKRSWAVATEYPGPAVFGHSGGIVGRQLLICDGVELIVEEDERRFAASNSCYVGTIDADHHTKIDWRKAPSHPGKPLYRSAAAGVPGLGVVMIGGSDNPYNYNGIGYDDRPSDASTAMLRYSFDEDRWDVLAPKLAASMDHRGLAYAAGRWYLVGGMTSGQRVTSDVASVAFSIAP